MKYFLGCELAYDVAANTTMILNVEVQRGASQTIISERFVTPPGVEPQVHEFPETGNRYQRLHLHPGTSVIRYEAEVSTSPTVHDPASVVDIAVTDLPFEVLDHLYPSRYCQSDRLARFAWREFGSIEGSFQKVTGICNWIFDNVDYIAGTSDGSTSALETFDYRAGVCRDFAHLGITLTRALGIPARYVSVYAFGLVPQDFHAIFEAYVGGRWYLFDATRLIPIDGVVRIAIGRDAADTAFSTFYGQLVGQPKKVWIDRLDGEASGAEWTTSAVSLG